MAVLHTSTLSSGIANVLERRKKSPPLVTTIGVVVEIVRV
jgi:hypothetical protein